MPNTLALIADQGITFNRYYVSYPLCCPSRVSLLTGRYAHNHNVRGNVPPNGGYTGFKARQAYSHNLATWLQGAGYRTIHIGKFLNGYGDEPFDERQRRAARLERLALGPQGRHRPLLLRLHAERQRLARRPVRRLRQLGNARIRRTRRLRLPRPRRSNGKPCFYETDVFSRIACEELIGTSPEQPFYLQLDYTAPHGDFRRPAGPEPATRHYDTFAGAPYPHGRSQGFNEGNVNDKPRFIREAPYLSPTEIHTYRVYYQKALESLRSIDEGVKQIVDTLGGHAPAAQHLHHLHLRQRLLLRRAPADRRQVPRLRAVHPPAAADPRAGDQTGHLDRRAGGQHRHRPDDPRTGRRRSGQEHRRPLAGPLHAATRPCARGGRSSSSPSSRPTTSKRTANRPPSARRRRSVAAPRGARDGASASIVAPPKDYEGIRLGPYKYIEWPDGEKELYDITKDPYELNNIVRDPNLFPIRAFLHAQLIRLETCVGRTCQEVAPKFPLTREQQRKVDKERREEERRKEKEREEKRHHKRRRLRSGAVASRSVGGAQRKR